MEKKAPLTKDDWVNAGFYALTMGGPAAIKIEPISRKLGVSKGSFYWHFKDAAHLKIAMLEYWVQTATIGIIEDVEGAHTSPTDQLIKLIELATDDTKSDWGVMAEAAIRDWARYDQTVSETLTKVDDRRMNYVYNLFEQAGMDREHGAFFSKVLYGALIGFQHLSQTGLIDFRKDMSELLLMLVSNIPEQLT